jgi:hypothetical protein
VEKILSLERAQTESTLILCWALTDDIILRNKKQNETLDSSPLQLSSPKSSFLASSSLEYILEELSMAKDCLKVLKKKPFFGNLLTN